MIVAPSPHYARIPELFQMAEHLAILFPKTIKILACEVADPYQIREGLSDTVREALPGFLTRAQEIVDSWLPAHPSSA